jgi:sensor histidine kinase regulating citrate/malate metabolism
MASPLEQEFKYYLDHQEELVKKYNGKFIVIKDRKVIRACDSELEAIAETVKEHDLGTFLVQKCEPGSAGYTQTYHSRVAFA